MKKWHFPVIFLYICLYSLMANSYVWLTGGLAPLWWLLPVFLLINLLAGCVLIKTQNRRLRICGHGLVLLLIFLGSSAASILYHIYLAVQTIPNDWPTLLWSGGLCICVEAALFWNGILCVYFTSTQLGITQRVVGILCGLIPVVNLIVLFFIIRTVYREVAFETQREASFANQKELQLCKTKYPILLVHGVFFRDTKYFNYWGRIPAELEMNGATVHYGNHQSAASVADCGTELAQRIRSLVQQTNCEKVNIIAHSKGGLDCRYALANLDAADYVASLTTINTPHRGCVFADYLLNVIPEDVQQKVALAYNTTLKKLGDPNPDFMGAVQDLTASVCQQFDSSTPAPAGIFCQSVGSILPKARSGKFPMNFCFPLVTYFDGPNDGLVSETSFEWGEKFTLLTPTGNRGISHGDVIDLNRDNIPDFDVREFYVKLVNDLKNRGL